MSHWNKAKREATALEQRLEEELSRFSMAKIDNRNPLFVSVEEKDMVQHIEGMLKQMNTLLEAMVTNSDASAASQAQIQRHQEIVNEKRAQFRMAQKRRNHFREAEGLRESLTSESYKRRDEEDASAEATLMRERGHINRSTTMADEIYEQAMNIGGELRRQRQTFSGTMGRLGDVGTRLPVVNIIIRRIKNKKTRDNTIIALVVAGCICFLLWYWIRR